MIIKSTQKFQALISSTQNIGYTGAVSFETIEV